MRFRQWLWLDLKRLFRHKGSIVATLIIPIISLAIFGAVAVPLLRSSGDLSIPYAVCDEDGSDAVKQFIQLMTNSQALKELATAYPVTDLETAQSLLDSGQVSLIVHIPGGFYASVEAGQKAVVELIAYPEHRFEQTMVSLTLNGALKAVGQSQNLLQQVGTAAVDAGVANEAVAVMLDTGLNNGIDRYMQRQTVLGKSGAVSPMGEYLPVEYYLAALFTFFCALAALPVLHLTTSDLNGPLVLRGLLSSPRTARQYYLARLTSGGTFIFLTLLLLLPFSALISGLGVYWGHIKGGAVALALLLGIMLASLCFSALALLLGSMIKQPPLALWCGFYGVLLMTFLSGGFINESRMEPLLVKLSYFTPFKPTMNVIANTLFTLNIESYWQNIGRLGLMLVIFGSCGWLLTRKKGGSQ